MGTLLYRGEMGYVPYVPESGAAALRIRLEDLRNSQHSQGLPHTGKLQEARRP
jgi:hypothetical protein